MFKRALLSGFLVVFLVACGYTPPGNTHPTPKVTPTPSPKLTQGQVNDITKNFWHMREMAFINNDPKLLASVYAGPALDQVQAELYADSHDPYSQHPLPKYESQFISATAVNLAQPPQASWFAATITYYLLDPVNGTPIGPTTDGPWFFVRTSVPILVTPTPSIAASPTLSPSPKASAKGATPSPQVSASPVATSQDIWMAYLYYRNGTLMQFGTNMTQTNTQLKAVKESDYLSLASSQGDDYATYLNQLQSGHAPVSPPYDVSAGAFSTQWILNASATFGLALSGVSFKTYPDQPLIDYVDDSQNEVVLFALQRSATYRPQAPAKCAIGGAYPSSQLAVNSQYKSVTVNSEILILATIMPKSTPTHGGRLLTALQGEGDEIAPQFVGC